MIKKSVKGTIIRKRRGIYLIIYYIERTLPPASSQWMGVDTTGKGEMANEDKNKDEDGNKTRPCYDTRTVAAYL